VFGVDLTLTTAAMWQSVAAAAAAFQQGPSPWLRTESRRFEVHYQRGIAPDLDRVIRGAEAAYDRLSTRLTFVLDTKVPLIVLHRRARWTQDQVRSTPPATRSPRRNRTEAASCFHSRQTTRSSMR